MPIQYRRWFLNRLTTEFKSEKEKREERDSSRNSMQSGRDIYREDAVQNIMPTQAKKFR